MYIGVTEMPSHAIYAACPSAMFHLCGGDVFMSYFKGLNIFSKSRFWFFTCILQAAALFWKYEAMKRCCDVIHLQTKYKGQNTNEEETDQKMRLHIETLTAKFTEILQHSHMYTGIFFLIIKKNDGLTLQPYYTHISVKSTVSYGTCKFNNWDSDK